MNRQLPAALAGAVILASTLSACTRTDAAQSGATSSSTSMATTTTTTTIAPTTTTAAPTTTTTANPLAAGLTKGAKGPEVQRLEERLAALGYDAGKVDGVFDAATGHALMAFQKIQNLPRNSLATDQVVAALATASKAEAMVPDGGADRVEIDLKRQVLLLFKGGSLLRVLSVSTGNGKKYCVDGQCAVAVTPGGSFRAGRKIKGLRVSRLGQLYDPVYFNGGIAIHGAPSVPGYPASHGCVRIPMHVSRWFHDQVPSGTPVYVIGGKRAAVPFNEKAPGEASGTTTTTAPTPATVPVTSAPNSTTTTSAPPPSTTTSTTTTPVPTTAP